MSAINASGTPPADTSGAMKVPNPPISIAPGSAQITATIVSAEESEGGFHCTLKIEKVHRYGSSTPPLPSGSEIKALLTSQVIENRDATASMESLIAQNSPIDITLRYMGMAKMAGSDSPDWQVSSIK